MEPHDFKNGILAQASEGDPTTDLLSDVLRFVQLKGERVFSMNLRRGFDVGFQSGSASFHVVKSGEIEVAVAGAEPFIARAGDVLVFPHSREYALTDVNRSRSAAQLGEMQTRSLEVAADQEPPDEFGVIAQTTSATFAFEDREGVASLLGLLPSVIHIANDDEAAAIIRQVSQFLVIETSSPEPGASLMISRVIDILVFRSIRTWAKTVGARQGWVGALADPRMSRVVAAMHRDPARNWGLSELASIAGMSRSSFSEKFMATIGEPALRYLHRWRLAMAADLLRNTTRQVQEVAHAVGYESEAAFSRAYKTAYGNSPRDSRGPGNN